MTGQELIDYIEEGKLQDRHFFIDVEGYFSSIDRIMENDKGDIILSQKGRNVNDYKSDLHNRERYFSEWFEIIPFLEAYSRCKNGDKSFFVLKEDGTYCCADNYGTWEELEYLYYDCAALFGIEK